MYICVFRKPSMCLFLVWLIKALGLSIRLERAEFLSPSICIVTAPRSSCCPQLIKWVSPPGASTSHKARASYYFQSLLCCSELPLQVLFKCSERTDADFALGMFIRWKNRVSALKQRLPAREQHQFTEYQAHWAAVCTKVAILRDVLFIRNKHKCHN